MTRAIVLGACALLTFVTLACGSSGSGSNGVTSGTGGASPGKVTIQFSVAGTASYCATSDCGASPSIGIQDAAGNWLQLGTSCSEIPCKTCTATGCPGYFCPPVGIVVTGASMEWDGTMYR